VQPGRAAWHSGPDGLQREQVRAGGFLEALRTELLETGVDVTIVFPGVVATDIRIHGYAADGKQAGIGGLDETGAMSVERCSAMIVDAMASRRRELVMTTKGKLGQWLKLMAPSVVDRMAVAALKRE
jgi:short-subunit dehydrogenase